MDHFVITITRQFGSLGRPIAKKISELMNIEYYDRDIVDAVPNKMNMPVSVIGDEEGSAKSSFFRMTFPLGNGASAIQADIFHLPEKNYRRARRQRVLHHCRTLFRLCAPESSAPDPRVHLCTKRDTLQKLCGKSNLHMMPEAARKIISDVDKARDAYHNAVCRVSAERFQLQWHHDKQQFSRRQRYCRLPR